MQTNLVRELARALAEAPPEAPSVILEALRDLRDTPAPDVWQGICGFVEGWLYAEYADDEYDNEYEQVDPYEEFWDATKRVFFQTWPERSGDLVFPVSIADGRSPQAQYDNALRNDTTWEGEYGEARKGLLLYLVAEYSALRMPGHAAHFKHNQPEESQ